MKNILILHGTNGNAQKNWFPWLKRELERKGYKVWIPNLPKSGEPSMRRYNDFIFPKWKFTSESIIIGHSSGAVAALGILQELPRNTVINKAILVAGFTTDLGWKEMKDLFGIRLNWQKIKKQVRNIILYHSDNDPYIPLWHGEKLKKLLGAELIVMSKQGHFNVSSMGKKYTKFPELLEKIAE